MIYIQVKNNSLKSTYLFRSYESFNRKTTEQTKQNITLNSFDEVPKSTFKSKACKKRLIAKWWENNK